MDESFLCLNIVSILVGEDSDLVKVWNIFRLFGFLIRQLWTKYFKWRRPYGFVHQDTLGFVHQDTLLWRHFSSLLSVIFQFCFLVFLVHSWSSRPPRLAARIFARHLHVVSGLFRLILDSREQVFALEFDVYSSMPWVDFCKKQAWSVNTNLNAISNMYCISIPRATDGEGPYWRVSAYVFCWVDTNFMFSWSALSGRRCRWRWARGGRSVIWN